MTADRDAAARALLARAVPEHVRAVCKTLTVAGHQAVTVGGAVRDALLGRAPGDWDVATSARPDDVIALFRHTIPTGLQHGTVTVVMGRPATGEDPTARHVEVTTFRGEGAYSDARHPDHVVFGVPLVEDLARRDLVVNAIAYDPERDELHDPFGGRADLDAKRLRAVGDPVARFSEDGLRVMRAMRFAAQLEFELEAATEAAIAVALPSLAKVSRERVCEELRKTLAAREPSRGLAIAQRTGILASVLPELPRELGASWLGQIDRASAAVRLAALMLPIGDARRVRSVLKALKFSTAELEMAAALVGVGHRDRDAAWTPPAIRRVLAGLPAPARALAIDLWAAAPAPNRALIEGARAVLAARDPLAIGELAVTGQDVMAALAIAPGPEIGKILARLLDDVLEDPARNKREELIARVARTTPLST